MFRILDSVDTLNEKLGIDLTHHNINQVYTCQKGVNEGYYLKIKVPTVRLISCLPKTNKGMGKDFLIISGEWHNGLYCPTNDGTPGGMAQGHLKKSMLA